MNIQARLIYQIIITGENKEATDITDALELCSLDGFHIKACGCPIDNETGRIDITRFKIIAEKECTGE